MFFVVLTSIPLSLFLVIDCSIADEEVKKIAEEAALARKKAEAEEEDLGDEDSEEDDEDFEDEQGESDDEVNATFDDYN